MTNEEAKRAFLSGCPITFHRESASYRDEILYQKISALVYHMAHGAVTMSVELQDRCGHSVTVARPDQVTLAAGVSSDV